MKKAIGKLAAIMALSAAFMHPDGNNSNSRLTDSERINAINKEIEESKKHRKQFKRPKSKAKKRVNIEYKKGCFIVDGEIRTKTKKQKAI